MYPLRQFSCLLPALCACLLVGCGFHEEIGPLQKDPVAIDLNGAMRANVELDMGAGQLNLHGGADKLLDGYFEYNVAANKPVVESARNGSHAIVTIKEPPGHAHGGRNDWNLQLNNNTLLDLALNCGAGQARLNLGDVTLRSLEVHMGAGQVDIDLRGHPTRDYEVNVAGGVGQATIHLPQDVGIRADAQGGIGEINVSGLEKTAGHYENSLYNKGKVNVRITVHGGIGEIRLIG